MGDCQPLFSLFSSFKQLTINNCLIKVGDGWIRTWVLCYWKWPLCRLCHNHCSQYFVFFVRIQFVKVYTRKSRNWNIFSLVNQIGKRQSQFHFIFGKKISCCPETIVSYFHQIFGTRLKDLFRSIIKAEFIWKMDKSHHYIGDSKFSVKFWM